MVAAQYYVEDSHPPIISKEEFAAVQAEFVRRANMQLNGTDSYSMKSFKEKELEQAFLQVMNKCKSNI